MSDAFERLEALLEHDAEGWRPEPGERLVGTVRDVAKASNDFSKDYPLLTIEDPLGKWWAVHAFHTVLWQKIAELEPAAGDAIAISFDGMVQGKSAEYARWRVYLERVKRPIGPAPAIAHGEGAAMAGEPPSLSSDNSEGAAQSDLTESLNAGRAALAQLCVASGFTVWEAINTAGDRAYTFADVSDATAAEVWAGVRFMEARLTEEVPQ